MFDSVVQQLRSTLDYSSSWGQLIVLLWIVVALIATVALTGNASRRDSHRPGPEDNAAKERLSAGD